MIPVVHMWRDDFGERVIPPAIFDATVFRKDGMPDKRFKVANAAFLAWLSEPIGPQIFTIPINQLDEE